MPTSLDNTKPQAGALPPSASRTNVIVSGYYGFGNLGDEAILEELTDELKRLMPAENIVVLSNNPQQTSQTFSVTAINRWRMPELVEHLKRARLFISGGGGLFQDAVSARSPVYYGGQIFLAGLFGVPSLIYAQGIGPLHGRLSKLITRGAMARCKWLTVRDSRSKEILKHWGLKAELTADPVWCLQAKPLADSMASRMQELKKDSFLVGLSLRTSHNFSQSDLESLLDALAQTLPHNTRLVLLPLQAEQDRELLENFQRRWQELGRSAELIDTTAIALPSQWISLIANLDLFVGMRLHALIMALKSAVPIVGIAYDPKVSYLLAQFQQPILNLTKEQDADQERSKWANTLKLALEDMPKLSKLAREGVESAKKLACQNFSLLDRILVMQSDSPRLP